MLSGLPGGATAVLVAAETLPYGLAITDPHGIVTWANAAYARLTACTTDELLGQSAGDFPFDELLHAAPSSEPWRDETVCRRKTGDFYPAKHTVTTLRNPGGEVTGFCIAKEHIEDITERQRARAEMEPLRSLFDNIAQGAAFCKLLFEGNEPRDILYISVNAAFEKITG